MIRILPCFIYFIIYLNRKVYRVFIISYISTMPLIIHVFYEIFEFLGEFEFFCLFVFFLNFMKFLKILKFVTMFYTLYHIFKQESIQGRGMIKGRPNNLSLVCLYLSLYISFLLFGHFFLTH